MKTFRNSAIAGTAGEASLAAVHGSRLLTVRDELELKVPSPKGGDGFMSLLTPRRERLLDVRAVEFSKTEPSCDRPRKRPPIRRRPQRRDTTYLTSSGGLSFVEGCLFHKPALRQAEE